MPTAKKIIEVPLTSQEAHVLMRAIATHNEHPDTEVLDRQTGTWLVERLQRLGLVMGRAIT